MTIKPHGFALILCCAVIAGACSGGHGGASRQTGATAHTVEFRAVAGSGFVQAGAQGTDCTSRQPVAPADVVLLFHGQCEGLSAVLYRLTRPAPAQAQPPQLPGDWTVDVTLAPADSQAVQQMFSQHTGQAIAVIVDGAIISAPTIQPDLVTNWDGRMQITGAFSQADASRIAADFSGAGR